MFDFSSNHAGTNHRLWTFFVWTSGILVFAIFGLIAGDVVWRGIGQINLTFLTDSPTRSGRAGGIFPILISTLGILGLCLGTAIPLSLATAIYLHEFSRKNGASARLIDRSLDVLAGVPSIVFGLFGNAFFAVTLELGFSLLSGGLTLACMALPLMIRSTQQGLRAVPDSFRLTAASLGLSRTSTIFRILLPAALPGILTGIILGIGRALAETAALLFTSGYVTRMPESLFDSGRTLSIHIYDLAMNVPGGESNAYGTALVLMILIVAINVTAGLLARMLLGRHIRLSFHQTRSLS
ncbi:MAG: phosphate ABC transporter permease PstA [Planctomycetaceae bacterium]|nr:phosphate ABC transporter permease PstA [Planctomycetaceae bacterium]